MIRKAIVPLLLAVSGILIGLCLLEIILRLGGQTSADGQFSFMGRDLHPLALPVGQITARIEEYLAVEEWATVVYDADLGWDFKPDSLRQGGIFTVNSAGMRATREYDRTPADDALRIALFGDSFTAGDDVRDGETWGHRLESRLVEAGMRAEVLNFGVSGYGMDQAYLRWRKTGADYQPDIVIFGLQPENLKRNVNVFRQALNPRPGALPFSKPRFVLDGGDLQLINSPAIPPRQLLDVYADFANHPLAAYEFHYGSRDVASAWWMGSRLASFVYTVFNQDDAETRYSEADTEGGQLGKAIVEAFAADVQAREAAFVCLHLPLRSHLIRRYSDIPPPEPPYAHLLQHCRESYPYIPAEEHIGSQYIDESYWTGTRHYGAEIHALIADVVADSLLACLADGSCAAPRLSEIHGEN